MCQPALSKKDWFCIFFLFISIGVYCATLSNIKHNLLYKYGPFITGDPRDCFLCIPCQECTFVLDYHDFAKCNICQAITVQCRNDFGLVDEQATFNPSFIPSVQHLAEPSVVNSTEAEPSVVPTKRDLRSIKQH